MTEPLAELILSHMPEDGSSIGNGDMPALLRERIPDIADEDYVVARDALIDEGVLGRGRGRGGSVFKVVGDDNEERGRDDDDFALSPTDEPEPRRRAVAEGRKAARRAEGPCSGAELPARRDVRG